MAKTEDRFISTLSERLRFFGRTAQALRSRLERSIGVPSRDLSPERNPASPARTTPSERIVRAPQGVCLYAVGDIHGRSDLLEQLITMIRDDAKALPAGTMPRVIFLGDYIDRGLKSREVVDYLTNGSLSDLDPIFLMGNHEEALLRFLADARFGAQWTRYGGAETLYSYGLSPPNQRASLSSHEAMVAARDAWSRVWNEFRAKLPAEHLAFYQSLKPYHVEGDYLFVHAGLRPGVDLGAQSQRDMLWIREEFLDDPAEFPQKIVHGHTPMDTIHHDYRRIGLDTGAFLTGRLTAARLTGTDVAFLST